MRLAVSVAIFAKMASKSGFWAEIRESHFNFSERSVLRNRLLYHNPKDILSSKSA
jgi:hypothetical protein